MTERQISARLNDWHLFGHASIMRRTLLEEGLITRSAGSSDYRRVEREPPAEVLAVLRVLRA